MASKAPESPVTADQERTEEYEIRVAKIAELKKRGLEPWPAHKPVASTCAELAQVKVPAEGEPTSESFTIAGRMVLRREHGKTAFMRLQDRTGSMQVYVRKDELGDESFDTFKNLIDLGDHLWVEGPLFVTRTGETTIKATSWQLVSKCLHPLPEKFHGLADVEQRYRQRYLDLISNPESREKFVARTHIIQSLRNALIEHDFIEVETPMLHPIPGGATARPFVTHHNTFDMDLYLRVAPELYLKRLVVGGFERVFEINRSFRNEGVSTKHNPEFTILEFYMAHGGCKDGMELTENIITQAAKKISPTLEFEFADQKISLKAPFARYTMKESLVKIGGLAAADIEETAIDAAIKKHDVTLANAKASYGEKIFALFEACVEEKLIQPTFITEHPVEISPLSKRIPENPQFTARFELFVAGMEFSNGFTELNDPFDQAERFQQQAQAREGGDEEAQHYDADYIRALEFGLPPAVGVGIGIDRLAMLLTGTTSIKDVILFPTLKHKG